MAQFLLLLYDDPSGWLKLSPEEQKKGIAKYVAWGDKASKAGYLVGSNKLTDDAGKIIRGPKVLVTDGPYSETKEVLGGYYMIEARNYEEAVKRSKDHPHLEHGGTIEVRKIQQLPK
jgi:hypothetical protein